VLTGANVDGATLPDGERCSSREDFRRFGARID
jgi:hypothetical protein